MAELAVLAATRSGSYVAVARVVTRSGKRVEVKSLTAAYCPRMALWLSLAGGTLRTSKTRRGTWDERRPRDWST